MPSARSSSTQSFDQKVFELLDDTWRTAAEVRRLLGGGNKLDVAQALDRLSEVGRIEKDAVPAVVGVARKGGGGELHFPEIPTKAGNRDDAGFSHAVEVFKSAERASTGCRRT
jgi:hypothetical protein